MSGFPALARRFGAERLIVIGAFAFAIRALICAVVDSPAVIVLASAFGGVGFSFFYVGTVTWVAGAVGRDVQATAQGIFSGTSNSIGAIVGSVVGGAIGAIFGLPALFGLAAAGYAGRRGAHLAGDRPSHRLARALDPRLEVHDPPALDQRRLAGLEDAHVEVGHEPLRPLDEARRGLGQAMTEEPVERAGVQRPPVDRDRDPRADERRAEPRRRAWRQVAGREVRAPAADREQGDVDPAGELGHRAERAGIAGEVDPRAMPDLRSGSRSSPRARPRASASGGRGPR